MLACWINANIMKNCCFVCQKRDFKRLRMFSGVFGKHLGCPMGVLGNLGGPRGQKGVQKGPMGVKKGSKRIQKGTQRVPKGPPQNSEEASFDFFVVVDSLNTPKSSKT